MDNFVLVEVCDTYIICHGSGLSLIEAHSTLLRQMMHDIDCTENDMITNLEIFELEANNKGIGVSYEFDGRKTTYYILDDPGNNCR